MSNLAVSTVIPTYNRARFILRALDSALRQCEPGDEIIVVDDGSTDNTETVLRPHAGRIRYIRTVNSGAGVARNTGVQAARNPLVAFLDSDDVWLDHKISLQRALMTVRPDVLFCFSDIGWLFPDGRIEHNRLITWHEDTRPWDEILGPGKPFSTLAALPPGTADFTVFVGNIYVQEMTANYINTSTLMVRRDAAGDSLHFGLDLPLFEDWECFGRLARRGPAAYMDLETQYQGCHYEARLTGADELKRADARLAILERVWGRDPEFLGTHRPLYEETLRTQYAAKGLALLKLGRGTEAREWFRRAETAPRHHELLSFLPGPAMRALIRLKRVLDARKNRS